MRMMVKALLFDSAGEIEKLQALQIDWAGCGVSELCATSDFAEAYRLTMETRCISFSATMKWKTARDSA